MDYDKSMIILKQVYTLFGLLHLVMERWYSVTQLYLYGTIATYNCNQGYVLAGDIIRSSMESLLEVEMAELSELGTKL